MSSNFSALPPPSGISTRQPFDPNSLQSQAMFRELSTNTPENQRIFQEAQQGIAAAMSNPQIQQHYNQLLANANPAQRAALHTAMTNPQALMQDPSLISTLETLRGLPGGNAFEDMMSQFGNELIGDRLSQPTLSSFNPPRGHLFEPSPDVSAPVRQLMETRLHAAPPGAANLDFSQLLAMVPPEDQAEALAQIEEAIQQLNTPEAQQQLQQARQLMETSPNAQLFRQHATPQQLNALEQAITNPVAIMANPELIEILQTLAGVPGGAELQRELEEIAQPPAAADQGSCCGRFFKWIQNNILDPIWNLFKCIFCCQCKSSSTAENENTQQAEQLAQRRQRELMEQTLQQATV